MSKRQDNAPENPKITDIREKQTEKLLSKNDQLARENIQLKYDLVTQRIEAAKMQLDNLHREREEIVQEAREKFPDMVNDPQLEPEPESEQGTSEPAKDEQSEPEQPDTKDGEKKD